MLYNILSGYTLGYTLKKKFHFKCNLLTFFLTFLTFLAPIIYEIYG
nr:MAG TPA: hypothetical protein [Caudoviricetes sp.]